MFEDWNDVELDLRVETTLALDEGHPPASLLVAFDRDGPTAVVGLRPFGEEGVLPALVEVLALLLPLGTDRIAIGLPAQAREQPAETSAADHEPADHEPADHEPADHEPADHGPVGPALLVAQAEPGADDRASLRARILPLSFDGSCWQWHDEAVIPVDAEEWEVTRALGTLLEARDGFAADDLAEGQLHAQLGRCLLLGHTISLAPRVADGLEPARTGGDGDDEHPGGDGVPRFPLPRD